ncbi:MAG: hypothetical protein ACYTG5_09020 [Planctomycetota bacterium]
MVKKSSFLEKLKSRWSSSSLRVSAGAEKPVHGEGARIAPILAGAEKELLSARKMSDSEKGLVAINEGFKDLAQAMHGMQTRLDSQAEDTARTASDVHRLPAINQAQVELLRRMSEHMDRQNQSTDLMATHLADLPKVMAELREALDRASAIDERTSSTLDQFRGNMDRIHNSMAEMVDNSAQQADAASSLLRAQRDHLDGFSQRMNEERDQQVEAVGSIVGNLETVTETGMDGLRKAQADQSTRLGKLIAEGTRASRAILILLSLTFLALVVISVLLVVG